MFLLDYFIEYIYINRLISFLSRRDTHWGEEKMNSKQKTYHINLRIHKEYLRIHKEWTRYDESLWINDTWSILDWYEILPTIISNKLWRHEFTNCELEFTVTNTHEILDYKYWILSNELLNRVKDFTKSNMEPNYPCPFYSQPFESTSMDDCLLLAQLYSDNTNAYSTTSMRPFEYRILDEKSYHTKTNQTYESSNDNLNYEIQFEVQIKTLRSKHQNDDHDPIYNLKLETTVFISALEIVSRWKMIWNIILWRLSIVIYQPLFLTKYSREEFLSNIQILFQTNSISYDTLSSRQTSYPRWSQS